MYSVKLDKDGYFTGAYAEIGTIDDGIDVENLPKDLSKYCFYKYEDSKWIFDEDKYNNVLEKR